MADQTNELTVEIIEQEEQNVAILRVDPFVISYANPPELMPRKPITIGFKQEPLVVVTEEEATVIGFGEAGTPGPPGPAGPPGGAQVEVEVYPFNDAATLVIDSAAEGFRGIEWLVTARDIVGGKTQVWQVRAVNDGSSADFAVFGKMVIPKAGGKLDVDTDVNLSVGNVRLVLTNNSGITLKITAVRYGMVMT